MLMATLLQEDFFPYAAQYNKSRQLMLRSLHEFVEIYTYIFAHECDKALKYRLLREHT